MLKYGTICEIYLAGLAGLGGISVANAYYDVAFSWCKKHRENEFDSVEEAKADLARVLNAHKALLSQARQKAQKEVQKAAKEGYRKERKAMKASAMQIAEEAKKGAVTSTILGATVGDIIATARALKPKKVSGNAIDVIGQYSVLAMTFESKGTQYKKIFFRSGTPTTKEGHFKVSLSELTKGYDKVICIDRIVSGNKPLLVALAGWVNYRHTVASSHDDSVFRALKAFTHAYAEKVLRGKFLAASALIGGGTVEERTEMAFELKSLFQMLLEGGLAQKQSSQTEGLIVKLDLTKCEATAKDLVDKLVTVFSPRYHGQDEFSKIGLPPIKGRLSYYKSESSDRIVAVRRKVEFPRASLQGEGFDREGRVSAYYDPETVSEVRPMILSKLGDLKYKFLDPEGNAYVKGIKELRRLDEAVFWEAINGILNNMAEGKLFNNGPAAQELRLRQVSNAARQVLSWLVTKLLRPALRIPAHKAMPLTNSGRRELKALCCGWAKKYLHRYGGCPDTFAERVALGARVLCGEIRITGSDYESVWLRVIQKEWKRTNQGRTGWSVPVEMDQGASFACHLAARTGNLELLKATNVISNPEGRYHDFYSVPIPYAEYDKDGKITKLVHRPAPYREFGKDFCTQRSYGCRKALEFIYLHAANCEKLLKKEKGMTDAQKAKWDVLKKETIKAFERALSTDQKADESMNTHLYSLCARWAKLFENVDPKIAKQLFFAIDTGLGVGSLIIANNKLRSVKATEAELAADPGCKEEETLPTAMVRTDTIEATYSSKYSASGLLVKRTFKKLDVSIDEPRKIGYELEPNRFGSYWPTLFLHNEDSWAMDIILKTILKYRRNGWAMSIHDAVITHPNYLKTVKVTMGDCLWWVYSHRSEINQCMCDSLGIASEDFHRIIGVLDSKEQGLRRIDFLRTLCMK